MKFKLEQSAFYMHEDKVDTGRVHSRISVEHSDESVADLQLVGQATALFMSKTKTTADDNGNYYITRHGIFAEAQLFASKEELLESL